MAALYLDEDVPYAATTILESLGHDATHANDIRKGAKDDIQLLIATDTNRVLVTCNRRDYVLLHDAWQHWSRRWGAEVAHAGILIVENRWPAALIAQRVHSFFAGSRHIQNRLYRWVGDRGWEEYVSLPL